MDNRTSYRAIVLFDLDNTLLDNDKQVPQETQLAIQTLQANKVLVGFSTGRNWYELDQLRKQLNISTMVAANGANVIVNGTTLYKSVIQRDVIARLESIAGELKIPIGMYNTHDQAITFQNEYTRAQYLLIRQESGPVDSDFYKKTLVYMMHLYVPDKDKYRKTATRFIETFPELAFYRNSKFSLDVVNAGVNKATGLEKIKERQEFNGLPVYAFGDGNNDIEILQAADYGIAMGNALPVVKEIADYVTTSNTDLGIPRALKHLELI